MASAPTAQESMQAAGVKAFSPGELFVKALPVGSNAVVGAHAKGGQGSHAAPVPSSNGPLKLPPGGIKLQSPPPRIITVIPASAPVVAMPYTGKLKAASTLAPAPAAAPAPAPAQPQVLARHDAEIPKAAAPKAEGVIVPKAEGGVALVATAEVSEPKSQAAKGAVAGAPLASEVFLTVDEQAFVAASAVKSSSQAVLLPDMSAPKNSPSIVTQAGASVEQPMLVKISSTVVSMIELPPSTNTSASGLIDAHSEQTVTKVSSITGVTAAIPTDQSLTKCASAAGAPQVAPSIPEVPQLQAQLPQIPRVSQEHLLTKSSSPVVASADPPVDNDRPSAEHLLTKSSSPVVASIDAPVDTHTADRATQDDQCDVDVKGRRHSELDGKDRRDCENSDRDGRERAHGDRDARGRDHSEQYWRDRDHGSGQQKQKQHQQHKEGKHPRQKSHTQSQQGPPPPPHGHGQCGLPPYGHPVPYGQPSMHVGYPPPGLPIPMHGIPHMHGHMPHVAAPYGHHLPYGQMPQAGQPPLHGGAPPQHGMHGQPPAQGGMHCMPLAHGQPPPHPAPHSSPSPPGYGGYGYVGYGTQPAAGGYNDQQQLQHQPPPQQPPLQQQQQQPQQPPGYSPAPGAYSDHQSGYGPPPATYGSTPAYGLAPQTAPTPHGHGALPGFGGSPTIQGTPQGQAPSQHIAGAWGLPPLSSSASLPTGGPPSTQAASAPHGGSSVAAGAIGGLPSVCRRSLTDGLEGVLSEIRHVTAACTQQNGGSPCLESLDLCGCGLDDASARQLFDVLTRMQVACRRLMMSGNLLTDQAMTALSGYTWHSPEPMWELAIADNQITEKGMEELFRCLYNHPSHPPRLPDANGVKAAGAAFPLKVNIRGNLINDRDGLLQRVESSGGASAVQLCVTPGDGPAPPLSEPGRPVPYLWAFLPRFHEQRGHQQVVSSSAPALAIVPAAAPNAEQRDRGSRKEKERDRDDKTRGSRDKEAKGSKEGKEKKSRKDKSKKDKDRDRCRDDEDREKEKSAELERLQAIEKEKEREQEREREREKGREQERERELEKEREQEREKEKARERQRAKEREERQREKEREVERERERARQRDKDRMERDRTVEKEAKTASRGLELRKDIDHRKDSRLPSRSSSRSVSGSRSKSIRSRGCGPNSRPLHAQARSHSSPSCRRAPQRSRSPTRRNIVNESRVQRRFVQSSRTSSRSRSRTLPRRVAAAIKAMR